MVEEKMQDLELGTTHSPSLENKKASKLPQQHDSQKHAITEHLLSRQELESSIGTDFAKGLSLEEAAARLEKNGPNSLTPPERTPLWMKFAAELFGGFSSLLWAGSVMCFVVYGLNGSYDNLTLGIVLAVVVILTAIFSFYQSMKAEKILKGFFKVPPTDCDIMRNGVFR
jgi:sodium/potassium-transporting ATPase subunit alpha